MLDTEDKTDARTMKSDVCLLWSLVDKSMNKLIQLIVHNRKRYQLKNMYWGLSYINESSGGELIYRKLGGKECWKTKIRDNMAVIDLNIGSRLNTT